jgi:alkylation response protein AidB-like acyl-CoA dehydrogenase
MNPTYGDSAEAYRHEVQAFLVEHLPAGWAGLHALPHAQRRDWVENFWRPLLVRSGMFAVGWPAEYGGGGLTPLEQVVLAEEFARVEVPIQGYNDQLSVNLLGPTLIRHGREDQKKHFLPKIISGEHVWAQGYSEPGAGSDLASLQTRAVRDGDDWVITGQKVWTSRAHEANWCFVLCRTDPQAPKRRGISFLLVPLDQPGVEVRQIRQLTGESLFNEVFFDGARTAAQNIIGEVNGGWLIANSLLGVERGGRSTVVALGFRHQLDAVARLAREHSRSAEPLVRQQLAQAYVDTEIQRYLAMKSLTRFLAGQAPGSEGSVFKLAWSEHHQRVTELAMDVLGMAALAPPGEFTDEHLGAFEGAEMSSAAAVRTFLGARACTIYAGSSEIQRNILGERVLGLPREPQAVAPQGDRRVL